MPYKSSFGFVVCLRNTRRSISSKALVDFEIKIQFSVVIDGRPPDDGHG